MPAHKKNRTNHKATANKPSQLPGPQKNGADAQKPGNMPKGKQAPTSPPPPKTPAPMPTPSLDYKEVQEYEVEALEAIWAEDFKPIVKTGAWNVSYSWRRVS